MGWFRRTTPSAGLARPRPTFGSVIIEQAPAMQYDDARALLLRIAAEAVIRSDDAEEVLAGIRARQPLGRLAPRGGPLVHRFFTLRDLLPASCRDPEQERQRRTLHVVLHHHAMLLSTAMDLAACEWRSERLSAQVDALDGLGMPGLWLHLVYAELAGSQPAPSGPPSRL